MAGPTIFIGRSLHNLKVKILEIGNLFPGIIYSDLIHLIICRFILGGVNSRPARPYGRSIFEETPTQGGATLFPSIPFQMADEAIGFTRTAFVPGGSVLGIAHSEGCIITVECGIVAREFVSKLLRLIIKVKVAFTVIFTPSTSWMAGSAILDEIERGFINVGGISVDLLSQLARISGGGSMFPVHSGGEIPRVFWIEGLADGNFSSSIGPALLEVISIGYSIIIMAGTTGSLRTVRILTIGG